MTKRVLSLCLTMLFLFSLATVAYAKSFSDVTTNYAWAKEAISYLADNEIVQGYPDGTFLPGNNITKQEAIALFARTMGSDIDYNNAILEIAYSNVESDLAKYDSYALKQAAYLMYKNVLSTDDLNTYLSSTNKGKTLKRYEAATLIAKCLGGDVLLKNNPDVDVSFTDSSEIPTSAIGYVYVASELGIITGMGENKFVPMGDVTRAQISVMIKRILDLMQFTYVEGLIAAVDATQNNLTIKFADGSKEIYNVGNGVAIMINGDQSSVSNFSIGMEVVLTFSDLSLYSIDAVTFVSDDSIEGVFRGSQKDTKNTIVKISPIDGTLSNTQSYPLSNNVVIKYKDGSGSITDFSAGDHVYAEIAGGKIVMLSGQPKTTTLSGATVTSIDIREDVIVTISTHNGETKELAIKSGASIRKNGSPTTFSDLVVGDKVDLTLEYGKIASAVATGISKSIEGTIEEIVISSSPSIKIKKNETVAQYVLGRDVSITVDGKNATIYDLKLGYNVSVTTMSSTVSKIAVTSVASQLNVTGQITVINTAYGMVKVNVYKPNGEVSEEIIFIKDNAKILDSNDNKVKSVKDLKVGQNITVAGAENVGVFEATSVMILSSNQ